jgi:hypothetical protein
MDRARYHKASIGGHPLRPSASSDDVGHAIQFEGGHLFRSEAGQRSDLKPATGALPLQVGANDVLVGSVGQVPVVRMVARLEVFQF